MLKRIGARRAWGASVLAVSTAVVGPDPFQWKFDGVGFRSMFPAADISDAMDTNLSAFRRHGGKLIMWQGWSDNGIPPSGTVDYYDVLTHRMGGAASTQQFARLFMVPTVYHCGGSYAGASVPDMIYPMVQWAEDGTAPSQLTATICSSDRLVATRTSGIRAAADPRGCG